MDSDCRPLFDVLRRTILPAAQALRARGVRVGAEDGGGWYPRDGGLFVRREPRLEHVPILEDALRGGDADCVSDAEAALSAHPVVGDRLGMLVGASGALVRIAAEDVVRIVLYRLLLHDDIDERALQSEVVSIVEQLSQTAIEHVTLAPLSGFSAPCSSIELSEGVQIARMTDQEVANCLLVGLIPEMSASGAAVLTHRNAVRIVETRRVRVVDPDAPHADRTDARYWQAYERETGIVERIVYALRVFKPGDVSVPGVVTFEPRPVRHSGVGFRHSPAPPFSSFEKYKLETEEIPELVELWAHMNSGAVSKKRFIQTAIRRFAFAGGRTRPEDRILDLMIAAEALFTPGTKSEVAHKVALHSAALLADSGTDPASVFREMKRGYGARSRIAHGDDPKFERDEGGRVPLIANVEQYIRASLRIMIRRAADGDVPCDGSDWNTLVLARLAGHRS